MHINPKALFYSPTPQNAMKRNMIAGDEEYKEPNKLVQGVILMVVILIVVLALGVYFFQKD